MGAEGNLGEQMTVINESDVKQIDAPNSVGGDCLWTVAEAARYLRLNRFSLYRLVSQKRIPVVKLSARCIRFRPSDLSRWVESMTQSAEPAGLSSRRSRK